MWLKFQDEDWVKGAFKQEDLGYGKYGEAYKELYRSIVLNLNGMDGEDDRDMNGKSNYQPACGATWSWGN